MIGAGKLLQRFQFEIGLAYPTSIFFLAVSIVLGGGTRAGYLADVLLQFLSIPLLLLAIWLWLDRLRLVLGRNPLDPELPIGAAMAVVGLAIALAQVIPLFGVPGWHDLSESIVAAGGTPLAGVAWTGSSSVNPASSLAALPAVLPALVQFLLIALLSAEQRLRFIGWVIAFGMISLAIGVVQVAQGSQSALRFFKFSHSAEAVGFFANRNHLAAQLYVTLVVGVAWFVARGERVLAQRAPIQRKILWFAWAVGFLLLILSGIALARSRAGILLAVFAAGAFVAMAPTLTAILSGQRGRSRAKRGLAFIAVATVLLVVGQLGADRFMHRFDDGIVDQIRTRLNARTIDLIVGTLPFGTGLGTFPEIYGVQDESEDLRPNYVNRAHNDWVEFPLETGIAGVLLMALFLAWFGLRVFRLWMRPEVSEDSAHLLVPQLASLGVLLLMLHSFVDYPLRTGTMLSYFAACCALMTPVCRPTAARHVGELATRSRSPSTVAPDAAQRSGRGTGRV